MPENPALYESLSPREFLDFVGELHGMDPARAGRRKPEMFELFGPGEGRDRRIRELSTGTRKRVALAGVFLHDPELERPGEPTLSRSGRRAPEQVPDSAGRAPPASSSPGRGAGVSAGAARCLRLVDGGARRVSARRARERNDHEQEPAHSPCNHLSNCIQGNGNAPPIGGV